MRGLGLSVGLLVASLRAILGSWTDFNLWGPTDATLVTNNTSDSTGGANGDTLSEAATVNVHNISFSAISVVAGQSYTFEVTLAPGTISTAYIGLFDGVVHSAHLNLATGAIGTTALVLSVTSSNAGLVNGYYRYTMKWVANTTGIVNLGVYMTAAAETVSYLGVITNNIKIHTALISKP